MAIKYYAFLETLFHHIIEHHLLLHFDVFIFTLCPLSSVLRSPSHVLIMPYMTMPTWIRVTISELQNSVVVEFFVEQK
jgi:hypothetical protein